MADPRLGIDYTELQAEYAPAIIDNSTITYDATQNQGSAQAGLAVTLSGDGTIALCADGDPVYGVLNQVEFDGKARVQTEGYVQVPGGTSALLTPKLKFVGALGASSAKGYIRAIAVATLADVAAGRGRIVDHSVTTAVWVQL